MTRKEIGDYAEHLVADHLGGALAPANSAGYDLVSRTHGRVQVKARTRVSKHLNWLHVRNVAAHGFDYLVLVELETDATVAGAWGMPWADVGRHAHSVVPDKRGNDVTKLAVRGPWKHAADRLRLGDGPVRV